MVAGKQSLRLDPHNTLHDMLAEMQYLLQARFENVVGEFETPHGEKFTVSDAQEEGEGTFYVVSYPSLPTDCYAEIEDGTYGELQGWRIYV